MTPAELKKIAARRRGSDVKPLVAEVLWAWKEMDRLAAENSRKRAGCPRCDKELKARKDFWGVGD